MYEAKGDDEEEGEKVGREWRRGRPGKTVE